MCSIRVALICATFLCVDCNAGDLREGIVASKHHKSSCSGKAPINISTHGLTAKHDVTYQMAWWFNHLDLGLSIALGFVSLGIFAYHSSQLLSPWSMITDALATASSVLVRWSTPFQNLRTSTRSDNILEVNNLHAETMNGKLQILIGFSAHIPRNSLVAFMGASGGGKTTLLRCLLRLFEGRVHGRIAYNTHNILASAIEHRTFLRDVAYIDTKSVLSFTRGRTKNSCRLVEHLTLIQNLHLIGQARHPGGWNHDLAAWLHSLVSEFGMDHAVDTRVLNLSGGLRRRLALLIATMSRPKVLIIDEPLYGLDAPWDEKILEILQRIVQQGTTVIVTLHQPSNEIMKFFDHLLFMGNGQCLHCGPPPAEDIRDFILRMSMLKDKIAVQISHNLSRHILAVDRGQVFTLLSKASKPLNSQFSTVFAHLSRMWLSYGPRKLAATGLTIGCITVILFKIPFNGLVD